MPFSVKRETFRPGRLVENFHTGSVYVLIEAFEHHFVARPLKKDGPPTKSAVMTKFPYGAGVNAWEALGDEFV